MTDPNMCQVVDLHAARVALDERDRELHGICHEMAHAAHALADAINGLRDAMADHCNGSTLVSLAHAVATADTSLTDLEERGWACARRSLTQ